MNAVKTNNISIYRTHSTPASATFDNEVIRCLIAEQISNSIIPEMEDSILSMSQDLVEEVVRVAMKRRRKGEHRG